MLGRRTETVVMHELRKTIDVLAQASLQVSIVEFTSELLSMIHAGRCALKVGALLSCMDDESSVGKQAKKKL